MTIQEAFAVVQSRRGIPREDDYELMEAAQELSKYMQNIELALNMNLIDRKQIKLASIGCDTGNNVSESKTH